MPGLVALAPGTVFAGDFRVVRKLSEGGMGAVYVALQLSTGRERALKIMHSELVSDAGLRAKFVQEARIGGRVQSDHVVEVVAAGVDPESNTPYLVMELLQGEDLATTLKSQRALGQDEITGVLAQLFEAVGAAHVGGIIHRDLKPENVFLRLSRSGAGASVKVLDFGIAKLVEEALSGNTGAVGTPFWMAPEQTERKAVLTPSCDVWALGLIAFTLHTGKAFWRAANDDDRSIAQFMRELVLEPIPPASERARELGAPGRIPAGFDAWFARAVNRDPAARFADARSAWKAYTDALGIRAVPSLGAMPVAYPTPASNPGLSTPRTDLGNARTMIDPTALDDDDGAAGVPKKSDPPWLAIGIGALVVALLGGAFAVLRSRTDDPAAPVASIEDPKIATPRCPVDMVAIPGGTFTVGDDDGEHDEKPAHDVTLNAFCMDLTEVTVRSWNACVKANACAPAATAVQWGGVTPHDHALWDSFCNGGHDDRADHPINCVAWDQARAYCKWADRRLPTEEEWELAARGPAKAPFPWGNFEPTPERVNVCGPDCALKGNVLGAGWKSILPREDGWIGTAPVGSFPAGKSPYGVHDMEGNVAEWTASAHCPYPGNNCASEARSVRGASFVTDEVRELRAAARTKADPATKTADVGFRCAR
jgi:formylglycine-generating enzyme required for sulfatase activity/serine/threonine protein kinase